MVQSTLAEAFRSGSSAAHRETENSSYIQMMIEGKITCKSHVAYLHALWFVYRAMEEVITPNDSRLGIVYDPALFRTQALAADYQYYSGKPLQVDAAPASPATRDYVANIHALANDWPLGLLAHHYTRYIGDLAGGQGLKSCVEMALQPEPGQGLAAFEFPLIADPAAYRLGYRQKLNSIPVTSEETEKLVEEVKHVFQLNRNLFIELASNLMN